MRIVHVEDYDIALKKWAYGKFMSTWDRYGPDAIKEWSSATQRSMLHGFDPAIHTWRDVNVDEYHTEGYDSDDSFAESADHGFRYSVGRNSSIEYSTMYQMGRTIFEISRIEITDEDRVDPVKKKRK